MNHDNPAARLLHVLEIGNRFQDGKNCREAWRELLDVESGNEALLISRLGKLMELPQQAIAYLEQHFPNQVKNTIHWQGQINAAFSDQNLNSSWQTFKQHIDVHTLNYLSLTADLIAEKIHTQLIPEESLKHLKEKIDDLLNEVLASNIEEDIKSTIARHLHKVSTAISEYRISGATSIMDSVEGAFGHSFFDERYFRTLATGEIGAKIVSTLSTVSSAVTIALGAPQLVDSAKILIERFK